MKTIELKHGAGATRIVCGPGLLPKLGVLVAKAIPGKRAVVVTDKNVATLYLKTVEASLKKAGLKVAARQILNPGEGSKTFEGLKAALETLLKAGLDRSDCVIALGGGVVGDIAGLAASLYKRGIPLVQAPTTLLSQVDSAIGGKNGINTPEGKNLIGTIWQPRLVVCDVEALKTLPEGEFRSGYAEVVKHAILSGEKAFSGLEKNRVAFFKRNPDSLAQGIFESLKVKVGVVEADEREAGQRMLLNLGHTFGHGLEAVTGYKKLRHGEAVALGLILALKFGVHMKKTTAGLLKRVEAHLEDVGLPASLGTAGVKITRKDLIAAMSRDKKRKGAGHRLIVPHALGDVRVMAVGQDALDRFLKTVEF